MDKIFYHIYPLGFAGAPEVNQFLSEPVHRLDKIYQWTDHLVECGFNAVYFGPLFESSSHGYDTVDYYKIDSRLGTNESFKKICSTLKERGISIILDGVFNHVSLDFPMFRDLREKGPESKYTDWFKGVSFDPFIYDYWEGHDTLVSLNLQNREVKDYIFGAVEMWYREFGIDGLRLDVAYCLDKEFLKELKDFCKSLSEDFWILGEVIHGDCREWLDPVLLDSVTGYECYKGIFSSLNNQNLYEIAHSLNRLFGAEGIYREYKLYNFIDNHDVNRISSILNNKAHIYNALILLFTMPGYPSIYYGSEWQIFGEKEDHSDRNLRPQIDIQSMPYNEESASVEKIVKKLISLRKRLISLGHGYYREMYKDNNQLVYLRCWEDERTICAINSSTEECDIEIFIEKPGRYYDYLNDREYHFETGQISLHLWSCWGMILTTKYLD